MPDTPPETERDRTSDRPLTATARELESTLAADFGEALVGLATFENAEYDVVYRDETASSQYTDADIRGILENIQLETVGAPVYEDYHGQTLRATVRVYDALTTVAVPVTDTTGLVVVLQNDSTHDPYTAIDTVESAAGVR